MEERDELATPNHALRFDEDWGWWIAKDFRCAADAYRNRDDRTNDGYLGVIMQLAEAV